MLLSPDFLIQFPSRWRTWRLWRFFWPLHFHGGCILSPQWKLSFILIVTADHKSRPEGGFYDATFLSYLWQIWKTKGGRTHDSADGHANLPYGKTYTGFHEGRNPHVSKAITSAEDTDFQTGYLQGMSPFYKGRIPINNQFGHRNNIIERSSARLIKELGSLRHMPPTLLYVSWEAL